MKHGDTSQRFDIEDQRRFAKLTGDSNPIHMDPQFARRTQSGSPVIHGVNLMLWLLDVLAMRHAEMRPLATLSVRFKRIVPVGSCVTVKVIQLNDTIISAEALCDGLAAVELSATYGPLARPILSASLRSDAFSPAQDDTMETTIEKYSQETGYLEFAEPAELIAQAYPTAARWLGPRRIAALGCTSRLVGMALPGLHSLYSAASFEFCDDEDRSEGIVFKVASFQPRFKLLKTSICGGGVSGVVEAFVRPPPAAQPTIESIASIISAGEFSGSHALVVGGSRGLGELTAKVLAAGGARVTITYAAGKADAEAVRSQITAWGGACDVLQFDARQEPGPQLDAAAAMATRLYYFASPPIFRQRRMIFDHERFDEFNAYYVSGFYRLFEAYSRRHSEGVTAFYPSSIAVEGRQASMTEYAMSKAAGERLCADINTQLPKGQILVFRLPRLATDQTSSILPIPTEDSLSLMVRIVRDVQANRLDAHSSFTD